jgi:hypothetical protein
MHRVAAPVRLAAPVRRHPTTENPRVGVEARKTLLTCDVRTFLTGIKRPGVAVKSVAVGFL